MKYLFFDTETSGLPKNWKAPTSDIDNWPRVVQLAYVITDEIGKIEKEFDSIVKPVGFFISKEASDIHGITQEIAEEYGVDLNFVLNEFVYDISIVDILVAHNMAFDEKVMGAECIRDGGTDWLEKRKKICTMVSSTNYCMLPNKYKKYGYKWPTLQELHKVLFNEQFADAHDALNDIRATVKCFFELKRREVL